MTTRIIAACLAVVLTSFAYAGERGSIAPELADKIPAIFPVGSKPEQVRALCGDPEFINQFSPTIVVWRYVSGEKYVLFSFENATLAAVALRPRVAAKTAGEQPLGLKGISRPTPATTSGPLADTAVAHSQRPRETWRTSYSERDVVLGAKVGSPLAAVREALAARGLPGSVIECDPEPNERNEVICGVDPLSEEWREITPTPGPVSIFMLMFEDDRLRAASLLSYYGETRDAIVAQRQARAALASVFQKPAKNMGFFRRKLGSMLMPGMSINEFVSWETETGSGAVLRGRASYPDPQNNTQAPSEEKPVLLVIVGEPE